MTEAQHKQYLRDNVEPVKVIKNKKLKTKLCPEFYLTDGMYYLTQCPEGWIRFKYTPTYKNYRSDVEKMRKKGLIYVEVTAELVKFEHDRSIKNQLKMF